jgi:D-galactarolactone cycloisomerase
VRIRSIQAIPVQVPRDFEAARGTAGTPNALVGSGRYRWSADYPVLYSAEIETALVRIETTDGLVGWGESQAPLAPQVACAIIQHLLAPVLEGIEFHGSVDEIETLWMRMYSTMRVRGQTGGFMLDAIAGVDIALWDLAGKLQQRPVCDLLAGGSPCKRTVPAYLSGVSGERLEDQITYARRFVDEGCRAVKVYYGSDWAAILKLCNSLRPLTDVAVDALWHLPAERAVECARGLDDLGALWLECPLMPEEVEAHAELRLAIQTPIAIGESYRTCYEIRPFLEREIAAYIQPDLGRCGLTESRRIAALARSHSAKIVPHVSIAFSPQLAAAIHFAAATTHCSLCEFNPRVLEVANRYNTSVLQVRDGEWLLPEGPGLGVEPRL